MESASSGQDGGGKKGPDTPSGGGGEASPAAASVVFGTGRYNDFVNSGEYLKYQGADVEMDTHPSVDIEGYPVGEAGSMMVDGLPFHALLMNTGTDQGTLLIASQSDTKSSLNLDAGANTGAKLHVRGYYYGPVATGGSTYPTVWSEDIEAMSK